MTGESIRTVAPGGTIGMLGGGQLGRMTALAAAQLGYKTHVFSPDTDSPCAQVSAAETVARYSDHEALAKFARSVDVVTLEWENIPVQTLAFLAKFVPVHPGPGVLAIAQDRLLEKDFVNRLGIATAPWEPARCPGQAAAAYQTIGTPCVMKSARMGYDGKGQIKLTEDTPPVDAWKSIGGVDAIVEGFVDFALEVSVIVARGQDGEMVAYPAVENRHANHILDETIAPAAIAPETAAEAERVALRIADALRFVGVLAVEMFVTRDGGVLVNELAPRPHNSGHWTMDACASSQFEQLVRAVCGLPLGSVERVADAVMTNLIGDDVESWPELLAEPGARLHLYGKAEARPGRKMGHVTRLKSLSRAP